MVIYMGEAKLRTIAQLQEFLNATQEVIFSSTLGHSDAQRYEHISRVLKRFDYLARSKLDRGVVSCLNRHLFLPSRYGSMAQSYLTRRTLAEMPARSQMK